MDKPENPAMGEHDEKQRRHLYKGPLKTARGGTMLALEPRVLLDAAIGATAAGVADKQSDHAGDSDADGDAGAMGMVDAGDAGQDGGEAADDGGVQVDQAIFEALAPVSRDQARHEVVFVDARVENLPRLLGEATPNRQVVVLHPNRDAVIQMTRALSRMQQVEAIHIFSHGDSGKLEIGSGELSMDNIHEYQRQLQSWAAHTTSDADILIYGCDVAAGQRGADFVQAFSDLTQADVAASTDITGASDQGGDWDLEDATGPIEAGMAIPAEAREQYAGTLAFSNQAFDSRILFDGTADSSRITIDNTGATIMDSTQDITIQAWVKPDASMASSVGTVVTGAAADSATEAVGTLTINNGLLEFSTVGAKKGLQYARSTEAITADGQTWTHVAACWDANSRSVAFYINGVLSETTYGVGQGNKVNAGDASDTITIGNRSDSAAGEGFVGEIDEVSVWQGSVPAISTEALSGNETGLVGYWKMDDHDGTSISDSQSNITAHTGIYDNAGSTSDWINPPLFDSLNSPSSSYVENGSPLVLDADATITDLDLSGGSYDGLNLSIERDGGASADDVFSGHDTVTFSDGNVDVGGTIVGSYDTGDFAAGKLNITFNASADASLVNQTLDNIAYSNPSDSPPDSVTLNLSLSDGTTTPTMDSITVNITSANAAPTGMGDVTLTAVPEDSSAPDGAAIIDLSGLNFQDADSGASLGGIAVVGNPADAGSQGVWQYSTNSGANWFDIGTVGDDATALALSSSSLMRFLPAANYNGAPPSLTVRALDNTYASGFSTTDGAEARINVDTTVNGGTTAIAAATNTIATSISAVNDAPVLDAGQNPVFTAINADNDGASGDTVASMVVNASISDVDTATPPEAIAVTAVDNTHGVWQYRVGADEWTNFSATTGAPVDISATAILLDSNDAIRFVPDAGLNGIDATLTFRAWDKTTGAAGDTVDASAGGGLTPYSASTDTAMITVDNVAPDAPTVTALTTSSTTPTISGTAALGDGETLTVTVGGATYEVTPSSGTWSLNLATEAPASGTLSLPSDGTYQVVATVTDDAGHSTSDATTGELIIDTTAPAAPTVAALTTNSTAPTITGTASPGAGESLSVSVGGATYDVTPSDGTWSLDLATATPASGTLSLPGDDTYQVVATVTDAAGNATSDTSTGELVIDTTAPSAPVVTALTTNSTTPTISGSASPGAGESLSVMVGGATYNVTPSDGAWSLDLATAIPTSGTLSLPSDGTYQVVATVTDAAGNATSDTSTGELIIDTIAPAVPTVAALTTNSTTPTISGTATLAAGEAMTVAVGGATYDVSPSGGSWSLDLATATPASGTLSLPSDGTYQVVATVTDAAGNATSDTTTGELVIDTTAPAAPTVAALTTNSTTPTISGTATLGSGETMTVTVGGATYDVIPIDGSWSLDLATATPASGTLSLPSDGTYQVVATVTDAAGNATSDTSTGELVIDTAAPSPATTVNTLITNVNQPSITGAFASADHAGGFTVQVNGITYTLGTDAALSDNGDNTWTLNLATAGQTLPDGTYNVVATATDSAGNTSQDGGTTDVTVDTIAPAAATVIAQATNSTTPTITGTATLGAGETMTVTVGGATYNVIPSDGTWSLDLASATPASGTLSLPSDGTYQVVATVTDAAGNATSDTSTGELTIDTTAPTAPTVAALTTNSTTPTISGTAALAAGEAMTVTVGGATYDVMPSGGSWSLDLATATPASGTLSLPGDGTYQVVATVTDAAGNATTDTTTGELIIDTTGPTTTIATATFSADTGTAGDFITNTASQTISGTLSANLASGETVQVSLDNGSTWTAATASVGENTWSLAGQTLTESNTLQVKVTDGDGKDGTVFSQAYVLDTDAPATPTIAALTTNSTTPTIYGTATLGAGESLSISVGGATYDVTPSDGSWSLDLATATPASGTLSLPSDGTYQVVATVTDAAGNATSDTTTGELVIDTTAPAAPTVTALSTNSSTPTISGTATLGTGEAMTVTVGGATYDVTPSGGTWSLDLATATPASGTLSLPSDGTYQVVATVTDAAGNAASDATTGELVIDTDDTNTGDEASGEPATDTDDTVTGDEAPVAPAVDTEESAAQPIATTPPIVHPVTTSLDISGLSPAGTAAAATGAATSGSIPTATSGTPVLDTVQQSTSQADVPTSPDTPPEAPAGVESPAMQPDAPAATQTPEGRLASALATPSAAGREQQEQAGGPTLPSSQGMNDVLNVHPSLAGQIIQLSPDSFEILLPASALTVGDITYTATQPDGGELPDYIEIDPATGRVIIHRDRAPFGVNKVTIRVSRIVQSGEQRDVKSASFEVTVSKQARAATGQ